MNALVTGGTGFIGSNLDVKLVKLGHRVITIGNHVQNQLPPRVKFLGTHLTGIDWKQVSGIDVVFHQAANNNTLDHDAHEMHLANVEGPKKLFKKAMERGCSQFVYASSTAVYGDSPPPYKEDRKQAIMPLNPYGVSKALFDCFAMDFAQEHRVNVVGLRYCNVYGPGEWHKGKRASMIYQIYKQMKEGKSPKLFADGEQKRDWCYVDDVVDINMLASEFKGAEIFNVGTGWATSFNDIVKYWNGELETDIVPEYIPNPYEGVYQNHTECSVVKAFKHLNWQAKHNVATGIAEFHKRLKEQ
jgi:ADP-L-glycero-D-manno-heptose 6-epimerase